MRNNRKALFSILILLSVVLQPFLDIIPQLEADTNGELESSNSTVITIGEEIDWPMFWQRFKKHAFWTLEWYDKSDWINIKKDLEVHLSYPEPNICKIKLVFDASHAGNYRLTFAVNRMVKDYIEKLDKWQYELTYEDIMITFDWSDCADIPGLQFSHGVRDGYFWFRIRRDDVPLGAHVEIDPATVGTCTNDYAAAYGFMRKSFYTAGLFWAFYGDGTNAGWEFSNDGTTWTGAFTSIGACSNGYYFSVWFDGTYIHYTRSNNYDLFYRRGIPVNDGSICWSAVEQTVYDGVSGDKYDIPCIAVDTNGYAWIGAYNDQPDGDDFPIVLKNANKDGTWTLDFAYELSIIDHYSWNVAPIPLTDGKVYVVYCQHGQPPLGQLWDGDWDAGEETDLADHAIYQGRLFSTVAIGDNVHFVYTKEYPFQIRHNERVWGVGWNAADVLVQDAVGECGPALSIDITTDDLYCFWTSTITDHVYYKKYSSGSWDAAATDWIDESIDEIHFDWLISSFYMDYGDYIGLLYSTKRLSPFNVRFAFLITPPLEPDIPFLVIISFNTTTADNLCSIYAEFIDGEGLAGYIFWNNATNAPGGINSSFTSMTGISNSTQENVVLPSVGNLFGAKYYVNDTDGNWGGDTLIILITAESVDTIIMGASGVFWIILIIIVPIVAIMMKRG